ncbi:DUF2917 domain-containing protein [Pyxidicoccus parkwayensis]|uniref:DUF2917 domain-containing protein n=2 Tax=Pyxidicoccus parkwayensis TaxID=2813578 RepID=A0ABX7PD45_9BACT|nr:DUF2917 domain-containing protein [Pyxidicoccus parkwaysis]
MRALAEWLRPGARGDGSEGPLCLELGATWSAHLHGGQHLALTCADGQLWLTREGDARDYVLGPGDTVQVDAPGHVVVQALRAARFCLAKWPSGTGRETSHHDPEACTP